MKTTQDYVDLMNIYNEQDSYKEEKSTIYVAYDNNGNDKGGCCKAYECCCNDGKEASCSSCCVDAGIGSCCCGC